MTTIEWRGAIADKSTAIVKSGRNEGGGFVTLLIPEQSRHVIGELADVCEKELIITIEVED